MFGKTGQTANPTAHAQNGLIVRAMSGNQELDQVHRLAHDGYVQRGYCTPQPDGRLHHGRHLDHLPDTLILGAFQDDTLIGTVSLTRDGDYAMPVDEVFAAEYDVICRQARAVGVVWRLATHDDYRDDPRLVIALFQGIIHHQVRCGIDVIVCTLNKRHERVYRRLFNMQAVAHCDGIKALANLPAVFMRGDLDSCHPRWLPQDRLINHNPGSTVQGQWTGQLDVDGARHLVQAA